MIGLLQAAVAVATPLVFFFIPGIAIANVKQERHVLAWGARVLLWSISTSILASFLAIYIGFPATSAIILAFITTAAAIIINRHSFLSLPTAWYGLAILALVALLYAAYTVPFLRNHDGLPTGDAQKSIYWANIINETNKLPEYENARLLLNRDPVDFYTPGLHTLVALVMNVSPTPLLSVGLLSILFAIATAIIAASLGKDLFDARSRLFPATLVMILVLTNLRFLRYLKEPGYHLQNIVGELLLFGLFMLGLNLVHRYRMRDLVLAIFCLLALLISHQFSSFIGVFMLLPVGIAFLISRRHIFMKALSEHVELLFLVAAAVVILLGGGIALGLHHKIPDLFTTTPHLLNEVPSLLDYPSLLGAPWLIIGLAGLVLLLIHTFRRHANYREAGAFCASLIILLLVSQGPRLFIDIPPVRALFYAVIPLSITGAYCLAMLWTYLGSLQNRRAGKVLQIVTAIILIIIAASSVKGAYGSSSHNAKTNSTLSAEEQFLIENINSYAPAGSLVVDDYNQRSASWLLLSGRPTFSRLASDIRRHMQESTQSPQRYNLYLNQLDFEKMYSLGNWPGVTYLIDKHAVGGLVGVQGSSASALAHNPILRTSAMADNLSLFTPIKPALKPTILAGPHEADITPWLLRPTTLVNDIGDDEDTLDYLPASLSATRTSNPQTDDGTTFRTTTAPFITFEFNQADYVASLWDKDHNGQPDSSLELFVGLTYPSQNLEIITTHRRIPISSRLSMTSLELGEVELNSKEHIVVTIANPDEQPVAIDMIALGLARVP